MTAPRDAEVIAAEARELLGRADELAALDRAGALDSDYALARLAIVAEVHRGLLKEMRLVWFAAVHARVLAEMAAADSA